MLRYVVLGYVLTNVTKVPPGGGFHTEAIKNNIVHLIVITYAQIRYHSLDNRISRCVRYYLNQR